MAVVSSSIKQHIVGLIVGLSAAIFSLSPYAPVFEEQGGLDVLFWLRGTVVPQAPVVTVAIDRNSSLVLGAADEPTLWPRDLHAPALRRLQEAGAVLIAFDIFFGASRPAQDEVFAAAMGQLGTVVLADFLKLKHLQGDVYVESVERPTAKLADHALATAPFLLPPGAEATRFLTLHGDGADQATLPLALLQQYLRRQLAALPGASLPLSADGNPTAFAEFARNAAAHPEAFPDARIPEAFRGPLQTLVQTYGAGNSPRYFNHYGPAGTIPRIPYHRLLRPVPDPALAERVRGKIVLIGFAENFQVNSADGIYYAPFSPVSSLELAATALANLWEDRQVVPAFDNASRFLWLFAWGYLLGVLGLVRKVSTGTGLILGAAAAYLALAVFLFRGYGLWLPLALPLFWQTPLALFGCLVGNYMARSREHRKIHSVIRRFIPVDVASQLIHPDGRVHWEGHLTFGACLATDAGQYTALAESMSPMALGELMNRYYATLFPAVTGNEGWVSDVVGDAMMAIWTGPENEAELRYKTIRAALDIRRALLAFEREHGIQLPIRMGLHCGEMRVGFVGASDHGEYRAVGDTVNTAARLEALNKLLGTRILLSDALIRGIDGFVTRPLGSFLLAGKLQPIAVSELACAVEEASPALLTLIRRFAVALSLYQTGDWDDAAAAFEKLFDDYPDDGPTRFYLDAARARTGDPGSQPPGGAIITGKAVQAHPV